MTGIVEAADLLDEGKISSKQLKQLFDVCFEKGEDFAVVYEREKPEQITDASPLKDDRRSHRRESKAGGAVSCGQKDHGGFLSPGDESIKGQANPALLNELVTRKLEAETRGNGPGDKLCSRKRQRRPPRRTPVA